MGKEPSVSKVIATYQIPEPRGPRGPPGLPGGECIRQVVQLLPQ